MKIYQSILMCILLVACDNQEQKVEAPKIRKGNEPVVTQPALSPNTEDEDEEYTADDEPTEEELYTYTDEEKAQLAATSTGIEKLLRTNPIEYDCVDNESAWSDAEFFERYISAISEDIENYIESFDDEYYKSVIKPEQIAQDTEDCRRYVKELAESSRKAYDTALAWFDADFSINPTGNQQIQRNNFRNILRMRLLSELFILGAGDRTFWYSIFRENPYLPSAVDDSLDAFDLAVQRRGMGTTMGDIMANNHVLDVLDKRIAIERECIRTGIYGECETTPQIEQAIQKFDASEKAWDEYRVALCALLFPVHNSYYSGSGIPVWGGQFSIQMRTSHRKYLILIAEAACGGYMREVEMIDFTQSEDTPRAQEARNKRPG